jgi:hypothetical protein
MAPRGASFAEHARRLAGDALGVRGSRNLMSWLVAGSAAYVLFWIPEQRRREERRLAHEQAKQRAFERGLAEIDRVRPRPDPQVTGAVFHGAGGAAAAAKVAAGSASSGGGGAGGAASGGGAAGAAGEAKG